MTRQISAVKHVLALAGVLALVACTATPATREKVLRIVPQSDLEILDPVFTTAMVTYNHANMIYDTLFGIDVNGQISIQMLETYDTSIDKKIWTFTLRDGLEFHDGNPVTSEDVIASIQRWGQKDTVGQRLMTFVDRWEAVNTKTFRMTLKEPYGLVLESLWQPFIMPKRVADTPFDKQITDTTGSGPFIYKKVESKAGEKVVYFKNTKYRPRTEPANGTAGGKVVKVDRVEWVIIKDAQTAANALATGEVDMIAAPAYEQYSALEVNPDIQMIVNAIGGQFVLRFNHLQPPFNNPKVRQAAMASLNQPAFLQTQVGVPGMSRTCFSVYPCNTPYFTTKGMDFIAKPDVKRAQQLLMESGYDGTPVVIMQPTDIPLVNKVPGVAAQLLREAGFKVDMQAMDWQTLVSRRTRKDGWNILITSSIALSVMNPVSSSYLSGACYPKAWPGWPCDPELEKLRDAFARALDETARKTVAEQVQVRAMEIGAYVPLGEFITAKAVRKTVKGLLPGYYTVLWNVEKQ